MEAGSRVWVKDKVGDQAWIIGTVVSRKAGKISVEVYLLFDVIHNL